jgi:glucosamine--fructose-6-phosphate aminotransferase (isomerizing)
VSLKDEIHEQPSVLGKILHTQAAPIRKIAAELEKQQIHSVLLAARGTSDNAGVYAKYLWGAYNQLPVAMAAPSLFSCYKKLPAFKDTLVVAISQSGESPDIVGVVEEGFRQGAPTLVITNEVDSPLARAAHATIDVCAGDEKAVAATKTYTAQLMAIAMLSAAMDGDEERWRALEKVPGIVSQTLALDETIRQRAERYRFMNRCVVLGRGFNYATAFEWALKLKELAYVAADPYSSADFQHGPVAMLERDFPVLAIAPDGAVFDDTLALLTRLREEQRVELLVISDRDEALGLAHTPLKLPAGLPEWLTPIAAIAAAQLFSYHVTRAKGLDTERPRGLRKITLTT